MRLMVSNMKQISREDIKGMVQEAASEYVWGMKNPSRAANQYKIKVLKQIIKEELDEVYSEKHRRWACAQTGDDFKGERSLSKEEAEEMCKGPMKEQAEEDKYEEIYGLAVEAEQFVRVIQDEEVKSALIDYLSRITAAAQEGQEGTF